jgi:dolichol-phosphate mannosyltransferase
MSDAEQPAARAAAGPPRIPAGRRPLVSIVSPVFNEEGAIEPFYERLSRALAPLHAEMDFEIIFTNNRSTDRTRERVLALRERDPSVQLLTYSRNFGQHASVLGGLRQASGDAIALIDVDCEDPPELIPSFIAGWREGHDIVYGERNRRPEPAPITWARLLFYRFTRLTADSDIILDMAEFCLMTDAVRDAVVSTRSVQPFVRGEIAHYGFQRKGIRYDRRRRIVGKSHYNLWRMTEFALAGILSTTTLPLRMPVFTLPLLVLANAALLALWAAGRWPAAFPVLVCLDLIYLSVSVSFVALYLGRDYRNRIARPLVVVDWRLSAVNTPSENSPNALPRSGPRGNRT